jgi:regulator of replication initiation timing
MNDECDDTYHKTDKADTLTDVVASEQITTGGQEADAATPETAPTEDGATTDPAETQKADFESEDVVRLVHHVSTLLEEVDGLKTEVASLSDENEMLRRDVARINDEREDVREVISKAMDVPLRPKAQEYIQSAVNRFPQYDPRLTDYLTKRGDE